VASVVGGATYDTISLFPGCYFKTKLTKPSVIRSPIDCPVDDKILNLVEGFGGRRLNLPGQLDCWEEVTPRSAKNVRGEFVCQQRGLLLGYGRRPGLDGVVEPR
jgi:hypothetical protein